MNNQQIGLSGVGVTSAAVGATPTAIAVIGPFPSEGAWVVTGTVTGTGLGGTGGGRKSVSYAPMFQGYSTSNVATGTDTYASSVAAPPMQVQPQDGGAGVSFHILQPSLSYSGNQAQLMVTGLAGIAINWSFNLRLDKIALP
jgi:hypothetical protein